MQRVRTFQRKSSVAGFLDSQDMARERIDLFHSRDLPCESISTSRSNADLETYADTEPYVAIPTVTGNGSALLSFTAAITAPITSVPPEGDQVVETASATAHGAYGRFVKKELDLRG